MRFSVDLFGKLVEALSKETAKNTPPLGELAFFVARLTSLVDVLPCTGHERLQGICVEVVVEDRFNPKGARAGSSDAVGLDRIWNQ